jgi:Protein of unknown function (DUF4056)
LTAIAADVMERQGRRALATALATMGRLRRLDWHEIAIWYGWANVPMFSERPSAFSPEDMYSNLLGIRIVGLLSLGGLVR